MRTTQRGKRPSVTIGDVARVAGVSRATASRALNDSPAVTQSTKDRVRAAVAETGFVMNAQGRALAVGRSESVAILMTEPLDELFADPTYASVLRGINDGLAETPNLPVIMQAWTDAEHQRAVRHFERRSVDAVISITPYIGLDMLDALRTTRIPVVLCGQVANDPYQGVFSTVYADDILGARLAGEAMVARGRRKIAIINGPLENPAAADRLVGYRESLDHLFRDDLTVSTGWDGGSGFEAARGLLAAHPDIDGVLAGSDRIAGGVLTALEIAGLGAPEDVSVIGFDDHAIAAAMAPPLTTIRQPMHQQGRLAAQLALEMIDGAPPRTVVLPMELVERSSV